MPPLTVLSWNVRGLNSKIKRSLVFNFLKKYNPHICLLQETHLVGGRTLALRKPWVGAYYHSTYSSYSRGVSVLIHKSLGFTLLDLHLDPDGRYIAIHAMCDRVELLIVGIYIPPPATVEILKKITPILAQYPSAGIIIAGDFNMTPDLDRMGVGPSGVTPLALWADNYGFTDVWRMRHPDVRQYTCHSAAHASFSRIDLIYSSGTLLPRILEVDILPRGISDHAPLLLKMQTDSPVANVLWRLSGLWIADERVVPLVEGELEVYWTINEGTVPPPTLWDAFKAYTRGQYQTAIGRVRKDTRLALEEAEKKVLLLEKEYVHTRNVLTYDTMQSLHREISLLRIETTRKQLLAQSQRIFEQGEKTGRMLAWLAKERSPSMHIAHIKDDEGMIHSDSGDINRQFTQYYQRLYTSRVSFDEEDLCTFLDRIDFPQLTTEARNKLEEPITLKEVQLAVTSLQSAKTPGPDGLPAEFYKANKDLLNPIFHKLLLTMLKEGSLPPTMSEAVIVVIAIPNKDPTLCSSYRPISLLNVDAKITTKILANRLNSVILSIVHGDQTGFMPGKGTDINLRRLYTNISHVERSQSRGVVASLDAEKAFDSVEWRFLWNVLQRFNFGPRFISWIKMLYSHPTARVHTNGQLSPPFSLERGTRQGCPLSPGLFALAIEPLAILLRTSPELGGIKVGPLTERLSLYADDALLYLPDASTSLSSALEIINQYGSFSGIRINWSKSIIFSLSPGLPDVDPSSPLVLVSKFRYLGIEVQRDPNMYLIDNVYPILHQLTARCQAWRSLPLSPVGRVNLLKMMFLPKFLYVFRNTPVLIPKSFFDKLEQVVSSFVWGGSAPRVARTTLQLPLTMGGLALPCFRKYYWAAVIVTVRWWFSQPKSNPSLNLEAAIMGSYSALSNLVFRGVKTHKDMPTPMRTTVTVWEQMSKKIAGPATISPHTPLWGNPKLKHLQTVPEPALWAGYGIKTIQQVWSGDGVTPYDTLKTDFQLPSKMFFRYSQLRHAVRAQYPGGITLRSHGVERLLISKHLDRTLSSIYNQILTDEQTGEMGLYDKWRGDVPDLAPDDWEEGIQQYIPLMISARDRFIQLKFIHRVYYTPQRLARIYPTQTDRCPKCMGELGTFIHVVWECPLIQKFWTEVVEVINAVGNLNIQRNPIILLLGVCDNVIPSVHKRLFVFYASFYARKAILLRWKQPDPPTVTQWRGIVDSVLPLYKATYINRKCPKKFSRIWGAWAKQ